MELYKNIIYRSDTEKFIVKFSYDAKIVISIKTMIPYKFREWVPQKKEWHVSRDGHVNLMTFALKEKFNVMYSAKSVLQEIDKILNPVYEEIILPNLTVNIPLNDGKQMYQYQKEGVAYNLEHKRVLNGDDMGLGKSVESIATILGADAFPCLVICPAHLKYNWKDEWQSWTKKRAVIIDKNVLKHQNQFFGSGYGHVGIVNYESLKKYFAAEEIRDEKTGKVKKYILNNFHKHFRSIIIDEIHCTSNSQNQRYKIIDTMQKSMNRELILGLSGTPVKNKVREMMYILRLLGALEPFGGQSGFSKSYVNPKKGEYGGVVERPQGLKELQYKLKKHCYFRREKSEVLKQLPDKFRQIIKVDLSNRKEYNKAEDEFIKYLKELGKSAGEIEAAKRAEILVQMNHLRQIAAKGKLDSITAWTKNLVESGEKIGLFAHHRIAIDHLREKFPDFSYIVGGMSAEDKDRNVKSFQEGNTPGILCSIGAASTGLTLTAANKMAFVQLPWTAAGTDQCEDRFHRIGQDDNVNCYYFNGLNTIDEYMYDIIQTKRLLAMQVTGASEGAASTSFHNDVINSFLNRDN